MMGAYLSTIAKSRNGKEEMLPFPGKKSLTLSGGARSGLGAGILVYASTIAVLAQMSALWL